MLQCVFRVQSEVIDSSTRPSVLNTSEKHVISAHAALWQSPQLGLTSRVIGQQTHRTQGGLQNRSLPTLSGRWTLLRALDFAPISVQLSAPPSKIQPATSWHLIGCQFERPRDSEDMACSKLTLLMLVITASLCTTWRFSTCSICWWTQVCDEKGENPVQQLLSVPPFCSQAGSLLSSIVVISPPAKLRVTSSNATPSTSSPPVISKFPTTYAASKATDYYPHMVIARSSFEWIASMVAVLFLTVVITVSLLVWMLSLPLISYVMTSLICETFLVRPKPSWYFLRKKFWKWMSSVSNENDMVTT